VRSQNLETGKTGAWPVVKRLVWYRLGIEKEPHAGR
jgi:hypothetical protein